MTYGPASVILSHDKSSGKRPADLSSISSKKSRSDDYVCYGCGKKNHSNSQCPSKAHPDYNTASIPWVESVPGIAWQASGDKKGEFIPFLRENYKSADTLSSLNSPIPANLLPCSIFVSSQEQNTGLVERGHRVNVLLDTGSLAGDFVSDRL